MPSLLPRLVLIPILAALILLLPVQKCPAWVGLEVTSTFTGVENPYGAGSWEGSGGIFGASGRALVQESLAGLDTDVHWLVQASRSTGDLLLPPAGAEGPFRYWDLERVHREDSRTVLVSEFDRLSLTWSAPKIRLTVGRQAVTWGEAYYFNIGDLFGAFPLTATDRRYKPGIDAASFDVELGPFSELSVVTVPAEDQGDSAAARFLFPLGRGSFSLTGGRVLEEDKAGAGYTVDVSGTQVYGSVLATRTAGGDSYYQAVLGGQRQSDPYTHLIGEIFHNGWGAGDPDDYPGLLLSPEFFTGRALTLGRYGLALQMSRQVSPLMTVTPALFANMCDRSALLRLDGAYSLSDLANLTGGVFLGLGKRPDGGIPRSEYGQTPLSLYAELVYSF